MFVETFNQQVAVITGAGTGIGFEIARQMCLQGGSVVLNDIDAGLAGQAAKKIQEEGGNCEPFAGDASNTDFIYKMVDTAISKFGSLDIAIANAGITLFADFFEYKAESLQKVMQLNLSGSFFLAQAAAKQMRKQGRGGSILFMSSVTGHQSHKYLAAYGMTKAGLEMLAKNLVMELSPHRITVNAIAPGATLTERTLQMEPHYAETWSALTPLGKPATTKDVASAVLFLVSPLANHITGQTLIVDGGWTSVSPYPGEEHFKDVKE
jgi:NAD(P)-dependent dehydrogenase (short-subunit alcohol dehydrogenase family)